MWSSNYLVFWIASMMLASNTVFGTEFTFDLADSIQECFYEMIKENVECTLDYQVSLSDSKKIFLSFHSKFLWCGFTSTLSVRAILDDRANIFSMFPFSSTCKVLKVNAPTVTISWRKKFGQFLPFNKPYFAE